MADSGASGGTSASALVRLFVIQPRFGPREGQEHLRVVFYHPKDESRDEQCRHIGFAEAANNFEAVFFTEGSSKTIHTDKTKTAIYCPGKGYSIGLTVSLPWTIKKSKISGQTESEEVVEYDPGAVHDSVLEAALNHAHRMFVLFKGDLEQLLQEECQGDVDMFKDLVSEFYSDYLPQLESSLSSGCNSVCDLFYAVQFLTLEPKAFLKVQCFVNRVKEEFPIIRRAVFFQQGDLVWSDLQQEDTRLLYFYITNMLLPSSHRSGSSSVNPSPFAGHQGRYIVGGPSRESLRKHTVDASNDFSEISPPIVHLQQGGEHYLIVYHAIGSTMCLLIPLSRTFQVDFFPALDALIGPHLTSMSTDLMDVFNTSSRSAPSPPILCSPMSPISPNSSLFSMDSLSSVTVRFAYFNASNCAMKSTLIPASENGSYPPPETYRIMLDLSEDLDNSGLDKEAKSSFHSREIYARTWSDQWVFARKVGQRQMYVVILSKCANLVDAAEEIERLMASEFKRVCVFSS